MPRFTDHVAIVTGAASGIGRATAEAFAAEGARVLVSDINDEGGAETVARIESAGGEAVYRRADVSEGAHVAALVDAAVARWGRLDAMVNNAGVGGVRASVQDYPERDWQRTMAINAGGVFSGTQHALRVMVPAGRGAVVNVASVAGLKGFPFSSAYAASKHAVIGLTRSAALEVARKGVTVNALCPVFLDTPMVTRDLARAGMPVERLEAGIPLGRLGTVAEAAEAILYLCSEAGRFHTGLALPLDGGMTAG